MSIPAPSSGYVSVFGGDFAYVEETANYLTSHGYLAKTFSSRADFLTRMQQAPPSLVLLEAAGWLPDRVIELVTEIRALSSVPCILRAREPDQTDQRVRGLEIGFDDWIAANTAPREVLARIRAVLRRSARAEAGPAIRPPLTAAHSPKAMIWRISAERRELFTPAGVACLLTSAEFDLIHALVQNRGSVLPRPALFRAVFRRPWHPEDRAIDNLVARLRGKLGAHSTNRGVIKPVRGVGYIFTGF